MPLKIKRYFWGLVILSALGFISILALEAYIKHEVTNRILRIDRNAQVDFSGSISLMDLSYSVSDFKATITPPASHDPIKMNIDSLKYKLVSGIIPTATKIIMQDPRGILTVDSFHMARKKDTTTITLGKLQFTGGTTTGNKTLQFHNPTIQISNNGKMQAHTKILFDDNNIFISLLTAKAQPLQIHFTLDNPYYNVDSHTSLNINKLTIPKNKFDLLKILNQTNFINFHLINKNIVGLHMNDLNTSYIEHYLTNLKMYDTKYQPAIRRSLDNFFTNKQDLYGYFHTKRLFSFGETQISRPLLILSNTKLPHTKHELENFRMPINTPTNFEPTEQNNEQNTDQQKSTLIPILSKTHTSTQDKNN